MKPGWPPPKNVWKPPVGAADEQFPHLNIFEASNSNLQGRLCDLMGERITFENITMAKQHQGRASIASNWIHVNFKM